MMKAFPTAEGFGKFAAQGVRGKQVYKVTNLLSSGTGSFFQAILDANSAGGGYIVFEVAGTIEVPVSFTWGKDVYVAGQTAFRNNGQGITLKQAEPNNNALSNGQMENCVLRHFRLRRGWGLAPGGNGDAITITSGGNSIIDHCSMSWTTDETFNTWGDVSDITLQNCILADALNDYPADSTKGKSCLIGAGANRHSIYRNFFANNMDRSPRIGGDQYPMGEHEVVNNLVYNYGASGTILGTSLEPFKANIIGNKHKEGDLNIKPRYAILLAEGDEVPGENFDHKYYVQGNINHNRPTDDLPEWDVAGCLTCSDTYHNSPLDPSYQTLTPFAYPLLDAPIVSTEELETTVLNQMGAGGNIGGKDEVDDKVIADYYNGTGDKPLPDTPVWPVLQDMDSVPLDSNNNGIPDDFESTYMNGAGANDIAPSGYPWIEEYFNYLVGEANPQPPTEGNIRNIRDTRKLLLLS